MAFLYTYRPGTPSFYHRIIWITVYEWFLLKMGGLESIIIIGAGPSGRNIRFYNFTVNPKTNITVKQMIRDSSAI